MIDIALIVPVRAYRDALANALASNDDFRVIAQEKAHHETLAAISRHPPAATVVDFAVVDFLGILGAVQRIAPACALVGFGIEPRRDHSELVVRAAELGLAGFIDADQPLEEIPRAVRLALRGESSCSPRIAALLLTAMQRHPEPPRRPVASAVPAVLTPRERVVAELVGRGLTNRQIAAHLIVEESTVKTHVHSILAKVGVARRAEIARRLR